MTDRVKIGIAESTRDRLRGAKVGNQSYDELITELLDERDENDENDLLDDVLSTWDTDEREAETAAPQPSEAEYVVSFGGAEHSASDDSEDDKRDGETTAAVGSMSGGDSQPEPAPDSPATTTAADETDCETDDTAESDESTVTNERRGRGRRR